MIDDDSLSVQVDVFYLHSPAHPDVPISETLAGINELYTEYNAFERFGLSNYAPADVEAVYDHCKANGYVLPSVFQGNYNPVARKQETQFFPTLRKLGIAFYVYSPLAGGFLTKTKQQVLDGAGRFDTNTPVGKMYTGLYGKPTILAALEEWDAVAQEEGCSKAELAYRWVAHNSGLKDEFGDKIIIGASKIEQIGQTVEGLKRGPLSEKACRRIDEVWEKVKDEAPLDNISS